MDFDLSTEQVMLRDSVSRYLGDRYSFSRRREIVRSADGFDPAIWQDLATALSVLGASFSEDLGGLGGGAIESMIIMEEIGRALAIEPYLETVVIGGNLLHALELSRAREIVEQICAGRLRFALAHLEPGRRFMIGASRTSAVQKAGAWRVTGLKDAVIAAPFATHYIVPARTGADDRRTDECSLFLVASDAPGLSRRVYPTVDGSRAADLKLEDVPGELIGPAGQGVELLEHAMDAGIAALCAEGVGVLRTLLADTVRYAKERKQFGKPIGANQALAHRLADMYIAVEQAISLTCMATLSLERPRAERVRAVSAAKVQIARSARFVGQGAVQIHGGMGMTDELAVSHYFKRATMIESQFGSADYHCLRLEQCDRA